MFAYCNNNPVRYSDPSGYALIEALIAAVGIGWTITIVVGGIVIICDLVWQTLNELVDWLSRQWYRPFAKITYEVESQQKETLPDVTYPGDDPTKAPDGYEWKGKGPQGSNQGNYFNDDTGESLHQDLNHPKGIDPHWDYNYRGSGCKGWRIFPDGSIVAKAVGGFYAVYHEWLEDES